MVAVGLLAVSFLMHPLVGIGVLAAFAWLYRRS